jgi:uncharacterized protein
MNDSERLIARVDALIGRVEALLPPVGEPPDWQRVLAWRWRRHTRGGYLQPVRRPHAIQLDDLQGIDRQKQELDRNTRQFVRGLPANNALLWGSRGTGKSSLVKALLNRYAGAGLRLVEVDKTDLMDLPDLVEAVEGREERFVLFCDDLSFEADDPSYKALKAVLDGSVSAAPDNVLIYATSNRRHLLPEYMSENLETKVVDGEIHPGEAVEEKISLSERFGLWLSFYPFNQDAYLEIVHHWLKAFDADAGDAQEVRKHALQWALSRGSRSGRAAWQFARDWAGRRGLTHGGSGPPSA